MPKNMRSYTLRQWLSHSENTTGESQKPVLDLYQEPHDSRGTTFNVIRMITVIINMMIACLIIRFDLMAVSSITCNDRMGGGWGICLHHTRGSGRGQPDAHVESAWIQVRGAIQMG